MKRYAIAVVLLLLPVGGASADQPEPGSSRWGKTGPGTIANLARHHQVMMYGVPTPYNSLSDPLPRTHAKFSRGATVFEQHCASCHGPSGHGEGTAGKELSPPPANLAWLADTPMSRSDPYMYWTIAEGGIWLGSDMPSFKGTLSSNDIWSVITYVREGMGTRSASSDPKRDLRARPASRSR